MGDVPQMAEPDASEPSTATPDTPGLDDEAAADAAEEANEQTEAKVDASEVNERTVDLSDDDFGGSDIFSGVEDAPDRSADSSSEPAAQESEGDGESDGEEESNGGDPLADGLSGNAAAMESSINDGAARLAVVGLTDEDFEDSPLTKESLEEEFAETFAAFRLGYFGQQVVDEYVLAPADGDVSPAWGLFGAVLIAGAMMVWLRPDGDEAVAKAREVVGNITGASE